MEDVEPSAFGLTFGLRPHPSAFGLILGLRPHPLTLGLRPPPNGWRAPYGARNRLLIKIYFAYACR